MSKHQSNAALPPVTVSLELAPTVERALGSDSTLGEALRKEITAGLAGILQTMGVPGNPQVELSSPVPDTQLHNQPIRVTVNGQVCGYPYELLSRVYSYVSGTPLAPESKFSAWLRELPYGSTGMTESNGEDLVAFLELACLEVVKRRPAVLLGPTQVEAYRDALPAPTDDSDLQGATWPPDGTWLRRALAHVLDLHISIADSDAVSEVLGAGLAQGRSPNDIAEDLVVALRPHAIKIHLGSDDLHQLTTDESEEGLGYFTMMRDGLFYELGVRYPDYRFVPVDDLKPGSFAFSLNHLTTLPWIGLQPDQCLVNDTADRLKLLNIEGSPASNPANANECSIIDASHQESAEASGLTTWDPLGYLILCFSATLRRHSASFVHRQAAQEHLDQLGKAFPALVKAVQAKLPVEQVTRVLRALIAEEISIRNLRLILEWMLDYDYIVTDPLKLIIFDDRLPASRQPDAAWLSDPTNLTSFVRSGMKRYISHKYTRGQSTLIVYLLHPDIEQMLLEDRIGEAHLTQDARDQILEAVRAEVESLPPSASTPSILTTIDVRPAVREITAPEFPRLPVLAYQELSPEMNIQPIARITLDT